MSAEPQDGGPAFPTTSREISPSGTGHTMHTVIQPGMTLRDYFAAHALTGIIATHTPAAPTDTANPAETTEMYHAFALTAYRIADAMLAERAK